MTALNDKALNNGRDHQSASVPVWKRPADSVTADLGTAEDTGLDAKTVQQRIVQYGANRIEGKSRKPVWRILWNQFENLIVLLLTAAAFLSFLFGQYLEGISIAAAILINAAIGFLTEFKAVRSMEAFQEMTRIAARVVRGGREQEIAAENLVPGDIVLLEAGDIVSADLRLTAASRLQTDESTLTGESAPVVKTTAPLEGEPSISERHNMLFKGTCVTRGSAKGVAVATGMNTELGKVASLTQTAEEARTPLEKRLNRLAYRLIWVTLGISILVAAAGLAAGKAPLKIVETAIALAVAAIPEGLPIVATIALARGMWRLAAQNAIMNRLSAVETLGAANVICTDKTGTLTENRMRVTRMILPMEDIQQVSVSEADPGGCGFYMDGVRIQPEKDSVLRCALEIGVLCNNAQLKRSDSALGDPMEAALLVVGAEAGIYRKKLLEIMPEVREESFDPAVKMMATLHTVDDGCRVAVKGAPEAVLTACTCVRRPDGGLNDMTAFDRREWSRWSEHLARDGLRVLALAEKYADDKNVQPYENLVWLGLCGLLDPPRGDVREAISACRSAGIRVVMVTGDHPGTARHIGAAVEMERQEPVEGTTLKPAGQLSEGQRRRMQKASIFARVSPEQKLNLIELHQQSGSVVAMTGDGVNDAPALKKADIGIAMGRRGTQVAREAADMVLKDDAFKTIVAAVGQGRAIFGNIRKFILFLLSGNMGEILIVAGALLVGAPLPLLPLQILYLNMIGDVFPALALGVGRDEGLKMDRPPRDPHEPVLTHRHWGAVFGYGLLIALPVLASFAVALNVMQMQTRSAVTVSFLTLAFARLWHVFNMREAESRLFYNEVTRNPFVWGSLALCSALLLAGAYLPGLSEVLSMSPPGRRGWLLIIAMSLIPLIVGQATKSTRFRQGS